MPSNAGRAQDPILHQNFKDVRGPAKTSRANTLVSALPSNSDRAHDPVLHHNFKDVRGQAMTSTAKTLNLGAAFEL